MHNEKPFILLGAGGHAKVLYSLVTRSGLSISKVSDIKLFQEGVKYWRGLKVINDDEVIKKINNKEVNLINGIGHILGNRKREILYHNMTMLGFIFPKLIHEFAIVDPSVKSSDGVQIMAGSIIQADCSIGANTIINTSASVDHECIIGEHVHVAPGAILCGGVQIEDGAYIGAGAVLIQGVKVGRDAVVGAGVVLTQNLESGFKVIGAPNRSTIKIDSI